MTAPKCFNSEKEWKAWEYLAKKSRLGSPRLSYCVDCTITYQCKMIAEGRCENPDTSFETVLNEDEEIERIGIRHGRNQGVSVEER